LKALFSNYKLKKHIIKNRIVLPPMVCLNWSDEQGNVSEEHIKHYEKIAQAGTGLIIIEATCIEKHGKLASDQLGIWDDAHIAGLSKIAAVCKKHGAVVIIQIHHAGLKTPKDVIDIAVSSSDYKENEKIARELTIEEIRHIQSKYVEAAVRAQQAGFDGIELHGAHGYLISQFLSPLVNKRTDIYGGEIENRMRFALEILRMIKAAVSENFIIGYRMGGNEPNLNNGIIIAKTLEKAGVDILHISSGIGADEELNIPENFEYNWIVFCGIEVKKNVNIPVIAVNDIRTPERAEYLLRNQLVDFTAIGKPQLADPAWTKHVIEKSGIIECMECKRCMWHSDGRKCPALKKGDK
jgi:2,4-dienoyl-CoA reductase-like NADH-dependent reductase (Old Yellow Enzyme family)